MFITLWLSCIRKRCQFHHSVSRRRRSHGSRALLLRLAAAAAILTLVPVVAHAASISATDIFTNWSQQDSPQSHPAVGTWVLSEPSIVQSVNGGGTFVSDFLAGVPFSWSVDIQPTISDNDNIGIVWGWQDPANHFRLGMERGGFGDNAPAADGGSGARGTYVVSEVGSAGSVINQAPTTFWVTNATYRFSVNRSGTSTDVKVEQLGVGTVYNHTFTSALFPVGAVGFYTESQTAIFSNFQIVPEPSSLLLAAVALVGLLAHGRRRRRNMRSHLNLGRETGGAVSLTMVLSPLLVLLCCQPGTALAGHLGGGGDTPPGISISPSGPLTVPIFSPVSYNIFAADPDAGDRVRLDLLSALPALPAGAIHTPSLPVIAGTGQKAVSSTFNWTPAAGQEGTYDFTYQADDITGHEVFDSIRIIVPVPVLQAPPFHFNLVRIGTTKTGFLTARNVGAAESQLIGEFPAAGGEFAPATTAPFGPLPKNFAEVRDYTYTPVDHGLDILSVTVTSINGGNVATGFSGIGVGPEFNSIPPIGSTLDFGQVQQGNSALVPLVVFNNTLDPFAPPALTGLTLVDAVIGGPDASMFSLTNFIPGTVLPGGDVRGFEVAFTPVGPLGLKDATLEFITDQGAPFGVPGQSFSFGLRGTLIPEPSTFTLAFLALVGLLAHGHPPSCWALK